MRMAEWQGGLSSILSMGDRPGGLKERELILGNRDSFRLIA